MRDIRRLLILSLVFLLGIACDRFDNSLITAHRGASGSAPENTMAAMVKAMEFGAGYAELDVQETADGELILLHDNDLERTAGVQWNIWETPYDSLLKIEVGTWFAPEFAGEPVPKLADVMDAVNGKMRLNIELKMNGHQKELTEKVVDLIHKKQFENNCVITSFDLDAVKKVRYLDKNLKVGFLFSKYPEDVDVFTLDCDILSVKYKLVNEEFMKKARAHGKEVYVWTVNDPELMKQYLKQGVASIITNYPEKLIELL